MANNENLIPPKKGEPSRNPNGRPKGSRNRSTLLKKWLDVKTTIKNPITKKDIKVTVEDEVVLALIREARKGNIRAIQEIQDSLYGKLTDKMEMEMSGGLALEVTAAIDSVYGKEKEDE